MKPSLGAGMVLAVADVRPEQVRAGNVVVFRDGSGRELVHRVVSTRRGIVTRGDNVARPDGVVSPERITGRVIGIWRGPRLRRFSRVEEQLWLHAASRLLSARSLLRAGARLIGPALAATLPLRAVRYQSGDDEQILKIYFMKKPVAWYRKSLGGSAMWFHPLFKSAFLERRLGALATRGAGE